MEPRITVRALFALALGMMLTGCYVPQGPLAVDAGDGSILASLDGVDSSLKAVNLTYNLRCAKKREAVQKAANIPAASSSDHSKLSFKAPSVASGDWCAIEVVATASADITKYSFVDRSGLFYATTAAKVDDKRSLALTIHQLYKDLTAPQFNATVSLVFPKDAPLSGVTKSAFTMSCGVDLTPDTLGSPADGKIDLTFGLKSSTYATAVTCTVAAKLGDKAYKGDTAVSIVNTATKFGPVSMVLIDPTADPAAAIAVSTTAGDACKAWDSDQYDCVPPVQAGVTLTD